MKHRILPLRVLVLLPALALAASLHAADPVTVVTDAVENATDWTRLVTNTSTNNTFVTSRGSLAPMAGSTFYVGGNLTGTAVNRGVARYFADKTLQAGTYTVTFDIGRFDTDTFANFASGFTISLLADSNSDGAYAWTERLTSGAVTASSTPTPATGTWETWTYTFTVDANTKTAAGGSVVGSTLGFLIVSLAADNSGYAFDNLAITYTPSSIPEPATAAVMAGFVVLAAVACLRRRSGK